jgi:hypothetical protein
MGAEEGGAKSCLLRGDSVPPQPRADRAKSHHVPHNNLKQAARPFPEIFVGMVRAAIAGRDPSGRADG